MPARSKRPKARHRRSRHADSRFPYLLVTLQREGEQDEWEIHKDGRSALKAALFMLLMLDELRVGDGLVVQRHKAI